MSFSAEEIAYLGSQPLARFATVSDDEQPDVGPVAFEFDGTYFWVGGTGQSVLDTRKFVNVRAGRARLLSWSTTWCRSTPSSLARSGSTASPKAPIERVGMVGPGFFLRITPTISWSWNMAGEPAGSTWYEPRRTIHPSPSGDE